MPAKRKRRPFVRYKSLEQKPVPKRINEPRPISKHDRVTYALPYSIDGERVVAIVRKLHDDGTATITACHRLDPTGLMEGAWLGYDYRVAQDLLTRG